MMKTAEEILLEKQGSIISLGPDASLSEAIQVMSEHNIGAILIKEEDLIVGIWTERDLLHLLAEHRFDVKNERLRDHMNVNMISAQHNEPIIKLQDKILGKRMRHLLIVKEDKQIGLLSAGDVTRASLLEKSQEFESLSKMYSWDYYENWKWKKK
jgi:CBS domain-containing protein